MSAREASSETDGRRRGACRRPPGALRARPRRYAHLAICLAAVLAAALRAAAAPEPYLLVEVGHGGAVRPGYYFPIRVEVQWSASPGEALAGEARPARLEVSLAQDQFHLVRLSRDVTIQPGRPARAVFYARAPSDVARIEIELREARGRRLARLEAQSTGVAGWWSIESRQAIVLAAGRSSLPRSGWVFIQSSASPIRVSEWPVADLPREWPGYDAVTLVLLGDLGAERLDAEQVRSLLDWVRRGGHLAISVTDQVETIRQVFAGADLPVEIGEYTGGPFDAGVSATLRAALAQAFDAPPRPKVDGAALSSGTLTLVEPMEWYDPNIEPLGKALQDVEGRYLYRRTLHIDSERAESFWRSRWSHERFDPHAAEGGWSSAAEGDIVCGRYGLGTITLLGLDPATLAGAAGGDARGLAWWHSLAHVPALHTAVAPHYVVKPEYWYGRPEDIEAHLASEAVNSILDDLSAEFETGRGLFAAIAVALLLLVALVGPVDYFVLRRLGREPLTWITTPALIALACAAIYAAQNAVSYGAARARRLSLIDAWSGADRGFAASFTAIASNRGGRYAIGGLPDGSFAAPACWTHPFWYYGDQRPAATVAIHHSSAGALIRSLPVPTQNVRWVEDRGPVAVAAISGDLRKQGGADEVAINLQAPPGTRGIVIGAWWNGRWYAPPVREAEDLSSIIDRTLPRASGDEEVIEFRRRPELSGSPYSYGDQFPRWWSHDFAFQIPGHRHVESRLDAIGPDVGVVLLELERPPDVQLRRDELPVEAQWTQRTLLRLIVPAGPAASAGGGGS